MTVAVTVVPLRVQAAGTGSIERGRYRCRQYQTMTVQVRSVSSKDGTIRAVSMRNINSSISSKKVDDKRKTAKLVAEKAAEAEKKKCLVESDIVL
jgi:hypothetical protein